MIFLSGISRRLAAAFSALIGMFGLVAALNLAGLSEIHDGLHEVKDHEEQVRKALELGSAIRDQYAHVAHTVILGNTSHLPFYDAARARVAALVEEAQAQAPDEQTSSWLTGIVRAGDEADVIFRTQLVPAVSARDEAGVREVHSRVQSLTASMEDLAALVAARALASIGSFEGHAGAIQHSTFRWTLASLIVATLFAIAVGAYLSRSIAIPIRRLGVGAARLASGDLETRIEEAERDELGQLARQFNLMTAALKEHQSRLVQSEKLAGLGRLAAGVAHEINNPLGVILGYTRLLQKQAAGEVAVDLKVIEDEALQCQRIVEGLLDLSRPIRLAPEQVQLRDLCEEVTLRLRESGQLEGVQVLVRGAAVVEGDAHHLRQIALNLVKNAAEALGAHGTIAVSITSEKGAVHLAVADDGPGLSADLRERIFEPFFTTKPSGTGLGLAVSQALARAHGGGIEAASAAGGGAVFTLRLPLPAPGSRA
jgi:two-component system NtrC family sensor kinase